MKALGVGFSKRSKKSSEEADAYNSLSSTVKEDWGVYKNRLANLNKWHFYIFHEFKEAKAACNMLQNMASRLKEEGGIEGYSSLKWAEPILAIDKTSYAVPIELVRMSPLSTSKEIHDEVFGKGILMSFRECALGHFFS